MKTPAHILATITAMKQPQSVICFPNNIVAIAGEDGCKVCEFSPNTKTINVNNNFPKHYKGIAAHPNKKMLAFYSNNSTTSNTTLAIYDVATTIKLWDTSTKLLGHPIFIPMTNEIVTCAARSDLQSFNRNTNSPLSKILDLPGNKSSYTSHPKEKELLFITDNNVITILRYMQSRLIFSTKENIAFCKYSPDGLLIAVNHGENGCSILDPSIGNHKEIGDSFLNPKVGSYKWLIDNDKNKPQCTAMAFHPTTSTLATLSMHGGTIYYWNFTTQQLITTTSLTVAEEECNFISPEYPLNQRLDFSCDGTQLIVALNDKCLILEVPFKIFKDKCIFIYWLLKNYQRNQIFHTIPDDIIALLMHNLLETSNFSLSNY